MLCTIGLHKWGKWQDVVKQRPIVLRNQIVRYEMLQKKTCKNCGTHKFQTISIG